MKHVHVAEQLYTFTDLTRLLKVPPKRLREMQHSGEALTADILVPGGGHKAQRWSASRVEAIKENWRIAEQQKVAPAVDARGNMLSVPKPPSRENAAERRARKYRALFGHDFGTSK